MDTLLEAYLPQDRRLSLARGESLPEHTHGAALFADIAGFTPLTEALDRVLGARRGVEAMTDQINRVYDALIAKVERFGGSVIGFAGDSITCWFDNEKAKDQRQKAKENIPNRDLAFSFDLLPSAQRAAACALALQDAMQQFATIALPNGTTTTLGLKIAIASGPARRMVVGDPAIQLLDTLAGATVRRMVIGEHLAQPGEVLLDEATAATLDNKIQIAEWRVDQESGERFALLRKLKIGNEELKSAGLADDLSQFSILNSEFLKPWLLPAIYDRHQAGLGEFIAELRPVVALFLRFGGIDYDTDPDAGSKLDTFIRRIQQILARYDGALLQLTIGDKGSYLYAAFGAPTAHEDDARRAAHAALACLALPDELGFIAPLQIGISRGVMRVGACGSASRRTYGAMGDEVNLAARLMGQAAPGEVLISGRVQTALAAEPGLSRTEGFALEPLEPIPLKGMPEPLPVYRLAGLRRRDVRLSEPSYALPMVGRAAELALIGAKLDLALAGHGQLVGIVAEAGMGKSRLLAEVIRLVRRKGLRSFGGACQSYGTNTPYLVWEAVWRAFFDLDPEMPLRRQIRALEGAIDDWVPERVEALPLLGPLLGLSLPENDFTSNLEPQYRKSALEALLLDCLTASAREAAEDGSGLLLVLEDLHWIDALSHDLLERVAQSITDLPVLIVLAYRPPELLRLQVPRIEALPHFTRVELAPLMDSEAAQIIRAKLAQLLPERKGAATPALIARITAKAQGNPFYVEELLNYLRDRGIDPQDTTALQSLDLPSSLHTLLLSRIDQLSARQQAELKVASVIGRLFAFAHLHGAFPVLGAPEPLKADLDELAKLELTPLDTPEPELAYLFKHIVTQEVAYASLTAQARASLHEQLAAYLERLAGDEAERYLDLLAFHYDRSDNLAKKRYFLRRAGEAAAARFANQVALDYLSRALELAPEADMDERWVLLLARETLYDLLGARDAQARNLAFLEALAEQLDDDRRRAELAVLQARYGNAIDDYSNTLVTAERAANAAAAAGAVASEAAADLHWGNALYYLADYSAARDRLTYALGLAQTAGTPAIAAECLEGLGMVAAALNNGAEVRRYAEQAYQHHEANGDRRGAMRALAVLSEAEYEKDDLPAALVYSQQSLAMSREIGDRLIECSCCYAIGLLAFLCGDYADASAYLGQALSISREIASHSVEILTLGALGALALQYGDYTAAQAHLELSLRAIHEIGDRRAEGYVRSNRGRLAHMIGDNAYAEAVSQQVIKSARATGQLDLEAFALVTLGHSLFGLEHPGAANDAYQAALDIWRRIDRPNRATEALAGLARVALAQGDLASALVRIEAIVSHLDNGGTLDNADEALRVLLTCYQVLAAAHDPRATAVLETAHATLQARMAKLPDEATRRMFLQNVPWHREIVAAWAEHASLV
jgi:adenylate cyclase